MTRDGSGADWDGTAHLSPCGRYRFTLTRYRRNVPTASHRRMTWIMLNPSTADAAVNDHTIRKCMGFASRWGYSHLTVVNLFAIRSRDPNVLYGSRDPDELIGPGNDAHIFHAARQSSLVVAAWGVHGKIGNRGRDVWRLLFDHQIQVRALRITSCEQPAHPLILPYSLQPSIMFEPRSS